MKPRHLLLLFLFAATGAPGTADAGDSAENERWIDKPQSEWPQITMINHIEYVADVFPVAGCAFLLDTGQDTLAATAKHVLMYFKSVEMNAVSFGNSLRSWKMYPKNNPDDVVIVDRLINEDPHEPLGPIPSKVDWLLFSTKEKSGHIQPLTFRSDSLKPGERVYVVGWRYTDRNCTQRIYAGRYVTSLDGSHVISTEVLADNTMPGLSGAPVIDAAGRVIGLMSQKHGKMEEVSSIEYPREVIEQRLPPRPAPGRE